MWTCLTVCLSNHDKSFISQKLKYQVKTPSKHNIAWIASFKCLQAFRFFQVCLQFLIFLVSKKQLKLDLTKNNQAWVELYRCPYTLLMCFHNVTVTRAKVSAKQISGIKHEKKKHTPLPTGCWRCLVPICFAVWGFWWKSTAWYILNNQNHIVFNRIGPNSYLDTTSRGFLMMIHFVFELFTRETVQWIILAHKRKSSSLSTWLKDEIML